MNTTREYQDSITKLATDAGWESVVRMNTPDGVKFPLVHKASGAFVVPMDDGDGGWSVHGFERDVKAWHDFVNGLVNAPVVLAFIQFVEENESYSLVGDTISTIVLDAWWWSEWAMPKKA